MSSADPYVMSSLWERLVAAMFPTDEEDAFIGVTLREIGLEPRTKTAPHYFSLPRHQQLCQTASPNSAPVETS